MRLVPLCIFRQTSKILCIRGGQRTKSTVFSLLLSASSVLHHHMLLDGEIGSDVISEKSLPFERQTQSLLSPCLALSHLFLCCLPIGPANGNKSLSQITISSHGLDSYIQTFFYPYLHFFPFWKRQ